MSLSDYIMALGTTTDCAPATATTTTSNGGGNSSGAGGKNGKKESSIQKKKKASKKVKSTKREESLSPKKKESNKKKYRRHRDDDDDDDDEEDDDDDEIVFYIQGFGDDEDDEDDEDDDDEDYETVSESDDDDDSDVSDEEDDDSDDCSDEDDEDEDSDESDDNDDDESEEKPRKKRKSALNAEKKISKKLKEKEAKKKTAKISKTITDKDERIKKNKNKNKNKKTVEDDEDDEDEDDEDEDDEDEDDDDEDDDEDDDDDVKEKDKTRGGAQPGIILSIDAFGGAGGSWNTDDADYREMMKEDRNEVCNSDDEETFMKEQYVRVEGGDTKGKSSSTDASSSSSSNGKKKSEKSSDKKSKKHNQSVSSTESAVNSPTKKQSCKNKTSDTTRNKKTKGVSSPKKNTSNEDDDSNPDSTTSSTEPPQTVESKYAELSQLKKDLIEQLQKNPKSNILKNAIEECKHSISELVRKERKKNTNKYYKMVSKEEEEKRSTNELSYFKKKLSHKEQLKVLNDLSEVNAFTNTDKPYRLSLLESNIPAKFKAIALQKLNLLKSMDASDSEYYKIKNWVDGFMRVPHGIHKHLDVKITDGVDTCHAYIENAKKTLDTCVYGLNDAKLQILQMVGQWISNPSAMGTAIAIKGPMGTGKTTLVKDGISKILGREFAFIALGGTGDASFLEGHSYTYEGSTWGKIVSILMESKCMNPVIYFDELDKISDTPRGEEIVSILTHLTDTTQNNQYHDKYFSEVDFDLSKCLFIFSYNEEAKVNPILRDRMYRIQTKGYESKEKVIIARKHLLPKIREQINFKEEDVIIPDETLQYIITNDKFSKAEQGVRNLKRCLEIIHTKLNLFRLVKDDTKIFEDDMKLSGQVKFPFTVEKKHVDVLIKSDDAINQSMLSMYV
jgi:ATP-dependent Lon protease